MNLTQVKCLLVFSVLAIIGFGPVSPTCLIGMYVVIARPGWFLNVVRNLYGYSGNCPCSIPPVRSAHPTATRMKCFLSLVGIFVLDIAPVPVASTIGFVIVLGRPRWFYEMVERIYFQPKDS
jgi:hypothetical protein